MRRLPNPPEYESCDWQDARIDYEPEDHKKVMIRLMNEDESWVEIHSMSDGKYRVFWDTEMAQHEDYDDLEAARRDVEEEHYEIWYDYQDWCQCTDPCCPCTGSKVGVP
tara:strand:+ start:13046 stop:13372 length:327 start_codon:yes stop_codon:yes gene_type:complete